MKKNITIIITLILGIISVGVIYFNFQFEINLMLNKTYAVDEIYTCTNLNCLTGIQKIIESDYMSNGFLLLVDSVLLILLVRDNFYAKRKMSIIENVNKTTKRKKITLYNISVIIIILNLLFLCNYLFNKEYVIPQISKCNNLNCLKRIQSIIETHYILNHYLWLVDSVLLILLVIDNLRLKIKIATSPKQIKKDKNRGAET